MTERGASSDPGSEKKEGEGKGALITGIEQEASGEAERIITDAKKQAEERIAVAQRQAQSILEEAGRRAEEQSRNARAKILAGLKIEIKRRSMRVRESVLQEAIGRAKSEVRAMASRPGYREVLQNWIVEAAVGLGAGSAVVNGSALERPLIDDAMLRSACRRVRELTGREVRLELSGDPPMTRQGVVLTASDGKTAFNNQVETRFVRYHPLIRSLIYEKLFGE